MRAGSHDSIPAKSFDKAAFSYSKDVAKPDPHQFVKAKSGNGGMTNKKVDSPTRESSPTGLVRRPKSLAKPSHTTRANPPNTELRRYTSLPHHSSSHTH